MQCLDITFDSPHENLAADEVLLDQLESGHGDGMLRFWESPVPFVVLGHGKRWSDEVDAAACEELQIPILRRCSGGGTVMQGVGCLNYAVVLPFDEKGPLSTIRGTNSFVMERHRALFEALLGMTISVAGHTDLVLGELKFSGNAQRRRRRALLFHGTFLLGLDLALMARVVRLPSVQPDYREGRSHERFVGNLQLRPGCVKTALREVWGARMNAPVEALPGFIDGVKNLALSQYANPEWNRKF